MSAEAILGGGAAAFVALLVAALRNLPRFLLAATEMLKESKLALREGRTFLRASTHAAERGALMLDLYLRRAGIDPEEVEHESDEMAVVRPLFEGDPDEAIRRLEALDPTDTMPERLEAEMEAAVRVLRRRRKAKASG